MTWCRLTQPFPSKLRGEGRMVLPKFLSSVVRMFRGIAFYYTDSRQDEKLRTSRQKALYNESFYVASLRNQLDTVLNDIEQSDKPIDSVVISVDLDAIKYINEAKSKLSCNLIPCAKEGMYILEREDEYL